MHLRSPYLTLFPSLSIVLTSLLPLPSPYRPLPFQASPPTARKGYWAGVTAHGRYLLSPLGPLLKLTLVTNPRIPTPFVYVCGGKVLHAKERRGKMKKGKNLRVMPYEPVEVP